MGKVCERPASISWLKTVAVDDYRYINHSISENIKREYVTVYKH